MKKTFIYDKIYKSEMQKTTNTNLAKYFSLAIIVYLGLNLTSCASGYFCTLNSRGEIPSDKTYYIVSVDSTETHYLEFQEYVSILEKRLGEIGYIESNPQKAFLRIQLNYEMGNPYLAKVSATANVYGSNFYATGKETETKNYKIPLLVTIRAFDNKTNKPIWEVLAKDELDRETQIQSVMPWLLSSIQEYIGKNSNGEQTVKIMNTIKNSEKYNLAWPY